MILGITTATVGKHIEHIYPKLGVENRIATASFASELSRHRQDPESASAQNRRRDACRHRSTENRCATGPVCL